MADSTLSVRKLFERENGEPSSDLAHPIPRAMMNEWEWKFCLSVLFVLGLVSAFFCGVAASDVARNAVGDRRDQYAAWVRVYRREDMTFEDWDTLRKGNFLPAERGGK